MSEDITVSSQLPALNKCRPPPDYHLPELAPDQSYLDYLQVSKYPNHFTH